MKKNLLSSLTLLCLMLLMTGQVLAQGVTTASMSGVVEDASGEGLLGANVVAVHQPSGTQYGVAVRLDGRYTIPAMRVGGPYIVTVSFLGYDTQTFANIYLNLGQTYPLDVTLQEAGVSLQEVSVIAKKDQVMNSERTGAATNISKEAISSLPTISRSIDDFTRLTPQSSGRSFGGQDARFNNLTIDGSIFNNSFGLSSTPGGQTNSTPISLDAIEEIQVNLAPYDVRQGGFTGAGINAITRQGDNEIRGSVFYNTRNEKMLGNMARGTEVVSDAFNVNQYGFRVGGPLIKNKLFFFLNGESERRSDPATSFIADAEGRAGNNLTRVQKSDLDQLRGFLVDEFGYDPGLYEGYSMGTNSDKILARLDWNVNKNNKFSLRYNQLTSTKDQIVSNSGTVNGRRRYTPDALNFQGANYIINNDIYSIIGELNTTIGSKFYNNIVAGYTANRDYRTSPGNMAFPLVDIMEEGRTYTSFGYEPFTANNRLDTDTWQFQNNFSAYFGKHTITSGVNVEAFEFRNSFTPKYYGHYTFNSLDDFYRAARGEEVELARYEQTYSALDGRAIPTATTKAYQVGAYLQDEFNPMENLKLTAGLRMDIPFFENTALHNPLVDDMTFRNPAGESIELSTSRLPKPHILWSPRIGFNWDVKEDRSLQVRGGSGLFAGRPAFVWISNQVGNNGLLTGSMRVDNTTAYPFSPDVNAHLPENPTTPNAFSINTTEENFRFPQVWRSNLAVDAELPFGFVGTFEAILNRNITNVFYYNANLEEPNRTLDGPDNRPIYPGYGLRGRDQNEANRINDNINDATVLGNYRKGHSYSLTWQIQKSFINGFSAMAAYNFAEAKDIQSAGSQAFSSWRGNMTVLGNNHPALAFSDNDQRHRVISSLSYRKEYAKNFASQLSLFYELRNQGRYSYVYNNDVNGDQLNANDLIFVPTVDQLNNMRFRDLTDRDGVVTSTAAEQRDFFNQYIEQDPYLSSRRGQYAERNGGLMPWVGQIDLSYTQDFFINVGGKRNTLQLRADIFNFGNMLNSNWGVGQFLINRAPISMVAIDVEDGKNIPVYQASYGRTDVENPQSFNYSSTISNVWQMQLGVRYIFN